MKTRIVDARREREERYLQPPSLPLADANVARLLRAGVDPRVARINLEAVKSNICRRRRWSMKRCAVAELEYKRMLTLLLWNPALPHPIVPTLLVDEIWHAHILDTRAYHRDMQALFGEYLHHFPYLGEDGAESERRKDEAFELSSALYARTFGEPVFQSLNALRRARGSSRGA